jgi:hypothetical protein
MTTAVTNEVSAPRAPPPQRTLAQRKVPKRHGRKAVRKVVRSLLLTRRQLKSRAVNQRDDCCDDEVSAPRAPPPQRTLAQCKVLKRQGRKAVRSLFNEKAIEIHSSQPM